MLNLPKKWKQPSIWPVTLFIFLLLVAALVLNIMEGRAFSLVEILVMCAALLLVLRMSTSVAFDANGVTLYFLCCIPQFVPWEDVSRIEYCTHWTGPLLIVEFFGIPRVRNCHSPFSTTCYLSQHPFRAQPVFLPLRKKQALFFNTIAQYHAIGGMLDLPQGELFVPQTTPRKKRVGKVLLIVFSSVAVAFLIFFVGLPHLILHLNANYTPASVLDGLSHCAVGDLYDYEFQEIREERILTEEFGAATVLLQCKSTGEVIETEMTLIKYFGQQRRLLPDMDALSALLGEASSSDYTAWLFNKGEHYILQLIARKPREMAKGELLDIREIDGLYYHYFYFESLPEELR